MPVGECLVCVGVRSTFVCLCKKKKKKGESEESERGNRLGSVWSQMSVEVRTKEERGAEDKGKLICWGIPLGNDLITV